MANFNIDYLVVAGGGGGSGGYGGSPQAGGGAGGLRTSWGSLSGGGASAEATLSLVTGTNYTVTIGAGGVGAVNASAQIGSSGGTSEFGAITTVGGGGARNWNSTAASGSGGSGGGEAYVTNGGPGSGTANQGFSGGAATAPGPGGGGGGAGSAGSWSSYLGIGGNGINIDITGSTVSYAGGGGRILGTPPGGGGQSAASNGAGGNGTANTGGGGGGGNGTGASYIGGNGGSGIVILRYATADANYTATGLTPTETIDGTDTILSFTTVGTGTITFTPPSPPPFSGNKVTTPVTNFNKPLTEEGLKIPSGTSSNQPTGVTGMIRNDTTLSSNGSSSAISYYNGTNWRYFENQEQVNPLILNSVMYYSASNATSYPGTGTSWFDLSGNANTATITSSNYSNGYFDLTPTSSIITSPVNTLFQTFSFSVWVKFDTVTVASGYASTVFSKAQFYASNHAAFPINAALSSTGNFLVALSYGNNYSYDVQNNTTVSANTWYNIAYVADSTANTAKLYIGTESTQLAQTGSTQSYTGTLVTNPNQFYSLGKSPSENGGGVGKSSLNGKIAKFGFWNTALTQSELITIWGLGSGVS